jgi:dihydroorotate dehydrogenase
MYKYFLKHFFFLLSPEKAHHFTTDTFGFLLRIPLLSSLIRSLFSYDSKDLEKELFGLKFRNPVGLAAGFDKDGKYINSFSTLGFGFYEVGTVTPLPQIGNPQPRLFRLPQDESLINRMGFNNGGVDVLVERLKKVKNRKKLIIGGNIGKNKVTPNDKAIEDYLICFDKLFPYVDYFVVNVSSPNTPGLRSLQDKEPLTHLLQAVKDANNKKSEAKPVLLKIAPDLTDGQLDDIIEIVQSIGIDGIIATNTTIDRSGLETKKETIQSIGNGGLSGKAVTDRSTEVIKYISSKSSGRIPIVGVGGIRSAKTAQEKIDAGASLVQVYSGLVYEGPFLIKNIKKGLS